ncbi:MAG TPA: hypothetical protein VG498_07310 [Terriglobales bacterium]|nr:hypothetical protein [Terriglobales bacterium]
MLAETFAVTRSSSTSSSASSLRLLHLGRALLMMLCLCIFALQAVAADPEISPRDLKGIPKRHKYVTSIIAGAAIGAGLGILAPGGNRSLIKGMLIGGSGASTLYLWSHRNAAGDWTQWAHVASNTGLATGLGWTLCNCRSGAGIGALLGAGGTLAVQSFGTRDPRLAKVTGAPEPPNKP